MVTKTINITIGHTGGPETSDSVLTAQIVPFGSPINQTLPVITGTAAVDETLSVSTGTWTNSPTSYTYQWLLSGVPIPGATTNQHLIIDTDTGLISAKVTAANAQGSSYAISAAVGIGAEGQLGAWSLSETSGSFVDSIAGNTATINVPAWTNSTHEHNRRGIVVGTDHALEVSNGGPTITMIATYQLPATSLVFYICPLGELRGLQHWDTSAEAYGREMLVTCNNGTTAGGFVIYRRWVSNTEWRLGGYVRMGAGDGGKAYFGGSMAGISGTSLLPDVAHRIVLTQGPSGATLFLDGAQVANLPAVTQSWSGVSTPIIFGSGSNVGHANDRSPFWGRIDLIEIWGGQMSLENVQALAPAVSSAAAYFLAKNPSDFASSNNVNISSFSNGGSAPQQAMAQAASQGGYVYQAENDATWYTANDTGGDNAVTWQNGCKGWVGVKIRRPSDQNGRWERLVRVSTGAPKFINCEFDANARGQDWHPKDGQPGYAYTGFRGTDGTYATGLEQARIMSFSGGTVLVDGCRFMDSTSDTFACDGGTNVTIRSNRIWATFRGSVVVNQLPCTINFMRGESLNRSRAGFGTFNQGTGLMDVEAFGGSGNLQLTMRDYWAEGDFDDESGMSGTVVKYINCHTIGPSMYLFPSETSRNDPGQLWQAIYCTWTYHSHGGNDSETGSGIQYPYAVWCGLYNGSNNDGLLFDHNVFVATGQPYYFHEKWLITPNNSKRLCILLWNASAGGATRLFTMRDCEFQARGLPSGINRSLVQCLDAENIGNGKTVRMERVFISDAFADVPIDMGGLRVEHVGCSHGGTGSSTPWSNATNVAV